MVSPISSVFPKENRQGFWLLIVLVVTGRHGIVTSGVKGMTTENALNCQPRTPQHTKAIDRFHGILGTGGLKTTGRGK